MHYDTKLVGLTSRLEHHGELPKFWVCDESDSQDIKERGMHNQRGSANCFGKSS